MDTMTQRVTYFQLESRKTNEFAEEIEAGGCLDLNDFSVSHKLSKRDVPAKQVVLPSLKRGIEAPMCGIADGCGGEAFPVHLFTGVTNTEGPKICVSGK